MIQRLMTIKYQNIIIKKEEEEKEEGEKKNKGHIYMYVYIVSLQPMIIRIRIWTANEHVAYISSPPLICFY